MGSGIQICVPCMDMGISIVSLLQLRHIQRMLLRYHRRGGATLAFPTLCWCTRAACSVGIVGGQLVERITWEYGRIGFLFLFVGRLKRYRIVDGHLVTGFGKIKAGEFVIGR